jgi:hypothetical protein
MSSRFLELAAQFNVLAPFLSHSISRERRNRENCPLSNFRLVSSCTLHAAHHDPNWALEIINHLASRLSSLLFYMIICPFLSPHHVFICSSTTSILTASRLLQSKAMTPMAANSAANDSPQPCMKHSAPGPNHFTYF